MGTKEENAAKRISKNAVFIRGTCQRVFDIKKYRVRNGFIYKHDIKVMDEKLKEIENDVYLFTNQWSETGFKKDLWIRSLASDAAEKLIWLADGILDVSENSLETLDQEIKSESPPKKELLADCLNKVDYVISGAYGNSLRKTVFAITEWIQILCADTNFNGSPSVSSDAEDEIERIMNAYMELENKSKALKHYCEIKAEIDGYISNKSIPWLLDEGTTLSQLKGLRAKLDFLKSMETKTDTSDYSEYIDFEKEISTAIEEKTNIEIKSIMEGKEEKKNETI